jgi:branched-chain amino acid transport system permease protein
MSSDVRKIDLSASAISSSRWDATTSRVVGAAALAFSAAVAGAAFSDFWLSVATQVCISVLFALSYNVLLGQSGLLPFGHAMFLGIGGFATIHLLRLVNAGAIALPVILLPLAGAAAAGVGALIVGWFATRRSGTAFAMISLGISELLYACAFVFTDISGGEQGISADRTQAPQLLGLDFATQRQVFCLVVAWTIAAAFLMAGLRETPLGRIGLATRDNAERVSFIGYDPNRVRHLLYIVSAVFAGLAGGLFAINYEIITYTSLSLSSSAQVLMMTFIGGRGYFAGPIVGAAVISVLQFLLGQYTELWIFYLGVMFALMIRFAPEGLAGIAAAETVAFSQGQYRERIHAYAICAGPALMIFVGFVLFCELTWRIRSHSPEHALMNFAGFTWHVNSLPGWIISVGLFAAGVALLRMANVHVRRSNGVVRRES